MKTKDKTPLLLFPDSISLYDIVKGTVPSGVVYFSRRAKMQIKELVWEDCTIQELIEIGITGFGQYYSAVKAKTTNNKFFIILTGKDRYIDIVYLFDSDTGTYQCMSPNNKTLEEAKAYCEKQHITNVRMVLVEFVQLPKGETNE